MKTQFIYTAPTHLKDVLSRFIDLPEGEYLITIDKYFKKRTSPENRYYHGCIVEILANHTGFTKEEMHEALKFKFLGEDDMITGLRKVYSSKKLTTVQFEEYCSKIRAWASEYLGCYIPLPNEYLDS